MKKDLIDKILDIAKRAVEEDWRDEKIRSRILLLLHAIPEPEKHIHRWKKISTVKGATHKCIDCKMYLAPCYLYEGDSTKCKCGGISGVDSHGAIINSDQPKPSKPLKKIEPIRGQNIGNGETLMTSDQAKINEIIEVINQIVEEKL